MLKSRGTTLVDSYRKAVSRMLLARQVVKYCLWTLVLLPVILLFNVSPVRMLSFWFIVLFLGWGADILRQHYRNKAHQTYQDHD